MALSSTAAEVEKRLEDMVGPAGAECAPGGAFHAQSSAAALIALTCFWLLPTRSAGWITLPDFPLFFTLVWPSAFVAFGLVRADRSGGALLGLASSCKTRLVYLSPFG